MYEQKVVKVRTTNVAMKATYGEVIEDDKVIAREIFKDPKTDSGFKKSAKGLLCVNLENERLVLHDQVNWSDVTSPLNMHKLVFFNGSIVSRQSLSEIRDKVKSNYRSI